MRTDYRSKPGYPVTDCPGAWEQHRKNQHVLIALYAGIIPFFFLVAGLLTKYPRIFHRFPYVMVIYMVCVWLASVRFSRFRCPRCGNRFDAVTSFGFGHNTFAKKCRNCGLRKWQCPGENNPIEPS
jgi:hypothetical protein